MLVPIRDENVAIWWHSDHQVFGDALGIAAIAADRYRSGMIWNITGRRSRADRWERIRGGQS
jgi:hypothetical protein